MFLLWRLSLKLDLQNAKVNLYEEYEEYEFYKD